MTSEFVKYLRKLSVSKATFYRKVKTGEFKPFVSRKKLIKQWIQFNSTSPYIKPWSETYKKSIIRYLQQYFNRFETISSQNLEFWLSEVDPIRKSLRRHRHSCVSSFARFLHHIGRLDESELEKIKNLYPKTPTAYRPKQRVLTNEQVEVLYEWDLCKFLAETGLRISEYASLQPSDLVYSNDPLVAIINVRNGKGNKSRVVPFSKLAQSCEIRFGRYNESQSSKLQLA